MMKAKDYTAKSGALWQWLPTAATCFCIQFFLLESILLIGSITASKSIVETLPGFSGTLPFKLETGYVGVGNKEDRQLFYYFVESERDPVNDPLLLWLTGGPGGSGLSTLARNIASITFPLIRSVKSGIPAASIIGELAPFYVGPLQFEDACFISGEFPRLKLNPYAWTKIMSVIFIDSPVGTGFSYSTTSDGWYTSVTKAAQDIFYFMRKWLIENPKFLSNDLYVMGESYGGTWAPMAVLKMLEALEEGDQVFKNLKGYLLGNPITAVKVEMNSRVEYAHRMGLISDQLYQATQLSCNGSYIDVDEDNIDCIDNLEQYTKCVARVNMFMILEPSCANTKAVSPKGNIRLKRSDNRITNSLIRMPEREELICREQIYTLFRIWANDPDVQKALHIRNGTVLNWERHNNTLAFEYDVLDTVEYNRKLTTRPYRVLVLSGDHDMGAPYFSTHRWIVSLNMTITERWRPWFVDDQVAGFTEKHLSTDFYHLTFATVKGAGHVVPEYKPKQGLELVDKWFSHSDF